MNEKREFPKMNQTERNAFKVAVTDVVKTVVIEGINGESESVVVESVVDVVGGFVLVTPKGYVQVSCVVKGDKFDLEDSVMELGDKIQNAIDKETAKAKKLAKAKAKKEKVSE